MQRWTKRTGTAWFKVLGPKFKISQSTAFNYYGSLHNGVTIETSGPHSGETWTTSLFAAVTSHRASIVSSMGERGRRNGPRRWHQPELDVGAGTASPFVGSTAVADDSVPPPAVSDESCAFDGTLASEATPRFHRVRR